jgi:hypothetical protein
MNVLLGNTQPAANAINSQPFELLDLKIRMFDWCETLATNETQLTVLDFWLFAWSTDNKIHPLSTDIEQQFEYKLVRAL